MIQEYKKISIIYGQSGRDCARAIHRKLQKLHDEKGMPVVSYLLAEELLSSEDIVSRVREIISSSAQCIILLTFDDVDKTRVRQNVLIEIGMALVLVGRERCYVVSERPFLPDDFPSDIRGALNVNCMDIRNADETAEKITGIMTKKLKMKTHRRILENQKYGYDYTKLLDDVPDSIFEEKPDSQMKHILGVWLEHTGRFTYTEERVCYILERVVFLSIFPGNDKLHEVMAQMKDLIRTEVRDFTEEETEELIAGRTIVMRVLEYIDMRLSRNRGTSGVIARYEYERIAGELENCTRRCDDGELKLNWYLQIIALDYAALARMHAMDVDPGSDDCRKLEEQVIGPLNRVEAMIRQYCSRAGELWSGYVSYNLSRAYEKQYAFIKGSEDDGEQLQKCIKNMRESSLRAVSVRRRWVENGMKGIFSTALSYEYFQAMKHEYELCENYPEYSAETPEKMTEDIRGTLAELSVYCRTTGLEKLFAIRESFEQMIRRVTRTAP